MMFDNSKCRGNWLHRFELVGMSDKGVLERCLICHKKVSHRMVDGSINNKRYLSFHMREGLQKDHRLFAKEYPDVR